MGSGTLEKQEKRPVQKYVRDPAAIAKKIHVPTYDEILERIKSRYPRRGKTLFDREMARLQATFDIAISKTDFIRDLTRLLDSLHPFYWRIIEIDFDKRKIRDSLRCISRARRVSREFYDKYRIHLMAAENKRELFKAGSEARGRILSLYKKCRRSLDYLRNLVIFIQHLPGIEAELPTIIVAGAPSTGKSTFIRSVSRAQPKVAPYPFTTTSIHIGHAYVEDDKIQVIDTPGLLDRDINEMNPVERRAIAALKELPGVVLFLIDVSGDRYMSIARQFNLLNTVKELIEDKQIIIGINKIDIADRDSLKEALDYASRELDNGAISEYIELIASDKSSAYNVIRKIYLRYFSSRQAHAFD